MTLGEDNMALQRFRSPHMNDPTLFNRIFAGDNNDKQFSVKMSTGDVYVVKSPVAREIAEAMCDPKNRVFSIFEHDLGAVIALDQVATISLYKPPAAA